MNNIVRFAGLMLATMGCVWSTSYQSAVPGDVKALVQATTKKWHSYHGLPSLRVEEKKKVEEPRVQLKEVIDPNSTDCRKLIAHFEKKYGIPQHLMLAISRVESRCKPWAIHHNGASLQFKQVKTALAFLKTATGNIQVGCMQLDCRSHQNKFGSLERMMMPYYNIEFSAKLLRRLYKRYGSWERAVSFYHAVSPEAQKLYCRRVVRQLKILKGDSSMFGKGDAWV
jgi:hypothetical protein